MKHIISVKCYGVVLLLFLTSLSYGEIISNNLTLKYNDILVVDNYSSQRKSGLIRVKTCPNCERENLKLDENSILIVKGKQVSMNNLLHTRLKYPSKAVRIQYNRKDKTVSYIRWQLTQSQEKGLL